MPSTELQLTFKPIEKAANIASVDDPGALRWCERFGSDRFTWPA
jgi:hypothetical protein